MLNSDNQEMTSLLNKVELFLQKNYIHCTKSFLKNKIELFKNSPKLEEKILEVIKIEDINSFIDKEKIKSFKLAESCKYEVKNLKLNMNLLFQIEGYSNIAEPLEKVNKANEANNNENLDELDNFESNYLQGDGEENVKQTEKVILKIKLTNGVDTFYGFEYEELTDLKKFLASKDNKFVKIIVGPEVEVRRGIFYLSQKNVKLI